MRTPSVLVLLAAPVLPAPNALATLAVYPNQTSYYPGETIELHISSSDPDVHLWIGREGATQKIYYSAALTGLEEVAVPESAFAYGCGWPVAFEVLTDQSWPTGAYFVRLHAIASGEWEHAPFTLKPSDPFSGAQIAYVRPISTVGAYNDFGGASYYSPNSAQRTHLIDFDRPFANQPWGAALGANERGVLQVLDNYDVHYYDSIDLHVDPTLLDPYAVLVTAYHDEYVSRPMYDAYEAFRDRGGNLLFLAANNIYWQIRFDLPNRRQICYKSHSLDPIAQVDPSLSTGNWRKPPLDRPEEALVGVSYDGWMIPTPGQPGLPAFVMLPDHWAFVGTGLSVGDEFGFGDPSNLIMGEWDKTTGLSPPNTEILLQRVIPPELIGGSSQPGLYQCTYYEMTRHFGFVNGSGARVFASGSNWYGMALATDPQVQAVTRNLLDAFTNTSRFVLNVNIGGSALPAQNFVGDAVWAGSGYGSESGFPTPADPTPDDAESGLTETFASARRGMTAFHCDVPDGYFAVDMAVWDAASTPIGQNLLTVWAEGLLEIDAIDLAAERSEGRGQVVPFVVKVEGGTLDLDFIRESGDLAVCALQIRNVWPDLREPGTPANPMVRAEVGGLWITRDPPEEGDVQKMEVDYVSPPDTTMVPIRDSRLRRPRVWIPLSSIPSSENGQLRIVDVDLFGNRSLASEAVSVPDGPTGSPAQEPVFTRSRIVDVAPNPFHTRVQIHLFIREPAQTLQIYDVRGRRIRSLDLRALQLGESIVVWDGKDGMGHSVADGTYVLRLQGGRESDCTRVVVTR